MALPAVQRRFSLFPEIGCIACRHAGFLNNQTQVHHLNFDGKAGQKRRGDEFSVPLCPWHHQGLTPDGMNTRQMRVELGPSLALHSREFRAVFGSDDWLLAETNRLLGELCG